jgi:hypothetical protein
MNTHNIISAVYTTANTDPGAPVQATRANGTVETRRSDDDIDGGGMLAFLAGGGVIEPYVEPDATKDELKTYAADVRWKKETGGTTVGGIPIPTDDRAKVLLLGAATSMAPTDTAKFIVGNTSVDLTGAQFAALYAGLVAHVQSCFETQGAVMTEIDAGTITTTAEIDEAFA